MTGRIVALVVSNALMLVLGAGLLPVLRLARTRRELLAKLPLAYAVGLVSTGVLAAELAVVGIPVGRIGLPLLAAVSLVVGLSRLEPTSTAPRQRLLPQIPALAILGVAVLFLVVAARVFAVKPLFESDGWEIWGTRGRALFEFGHPTGPVFTSALAPALQHPLWLPALDALDFRFLGHFDGSLAVAQLFGLAIALVGGGWVLLRRHAPPVLLAAALLAIVTAPTVFIQLPTNFADVPLGIMVALGLGALAAWLRSGESGLLPAAALFLGAGAITKNEGELFALAAFVAAAAVAHRSQLRPLAYAGLAVLAIDLPWRIWIQLHHVKIAEYSIANLFSPGYLHQHSSRLRPATHELWFQIRFAGGWSNLDLLVLAGLAGALVLRHFRMAIFASAWLALSFAGLVAIYWISTNPITSHLYNSSDRTIDALMIGATLLVPVLVGPPAEDAGPVRYARDGLDASPQVPAPAPPHSGWRTLPGRLRLFSVDQGE